MNPLLTGAKAEMLCGLRFGRDAQFRPGIDGTTVVDQMPISGPVYLLKLEGKQLSAFCDRCYAQSPLYLRRRPVDKWAHAHRCEVKHGS